MPRNRRPRDREEKAAEIVAAATDLFTDVGFEKTSLSSIASAAGVTTTTIYWYFDDKDALLVGVLDQLLADFLDEIGTVEDEPWVDQLLWVLDRLRRYEKLVTTVHALAPTSKTVGPWHERFHDLTNAMLAEGLRELGVAEERVEPLTRLGVFAIEGLLMHPLPREEQRAVLEQLVGEAP